MLPAAAAVELLSVLCCTDAVCTDGVVVGAAAVGAGEEPKEREVKEKGCGGGDGLVGMMVTGR